MRKNILVIALIAVVIAGGLAVFWASGDKARDAQLIVEETSTEENDEKIIIHFIPKNLGNPYYEALSTGFYDAISELGEDNFKYVYTGPQTAEADNQVEFVKKAIQDKADAIFIAANSNTALNSTFDEARGKGIRVYIINQDIPGSEAHRDAAIMPVNFDKIGGAQIELLGEQIGYEGQFAILSATVDAPDQNTWVSLMKEELKNNPKYQKMELLEVVYGDDQAEKSASEAKALLSKYPEMKGMVVPTAVGLPAVCKVVRESGLSGRIKITGLALPSEMAEFVLDGTCEGFQLWNPPYEGYMGVYMVWAEKKEGFVPRPGAKFTARKLGEYTIQPNGQILTLEDPMLYDKSNIERYSVLF
ncbi:MAG: substrate-binding domain-containing protein [Synergistaceae bacterium]|jgi:rhamnose transport system substrate-binding protein|nr:substrate-binding domain-containing protein [Synergistaceae bacterium]